MRKIMTTILLCAIVLASFSSCSKENQSSSESTSGTSSETSSEISSSQTEEDDAQITSSESSQEETDEPEETKITVNQEAFDDLRLTYTELTNKYGQKTDTTTSGGAVFYAFENGHGWYGWDITTSYDNSTDLDLNNPPEPMADTKCISINNVDVDYLFTDISLPAKISDIEEVLGIELDSVPSDMYEGQYMTYFMYDDIDVYILSNQADEIDNDTCNITLIRKGE